VARRGDRMRARRKVRKRFMDTVETGGLSVAKALYDFMNDEALPETGLTVERFWDGLGAIIRDFAPRNRKLGTGLAIIRDFAPRNRKLLDLRDTLQARIDDFHRARRGRPFDVAEYERFLHDIEYLAPEPPDFSIRTANVDDEITHIAGPQLVVPLSNARYALNFD
jgi:malate synthase